MHNKKKKKITLIIKKNSKYKRIKEKQKGIMSDI